MVRKKVEGDNDRRRKKARDARERGKQPSEEAATLGASKQRHHLQSGEEYVDKLTTKHRGKGTLSSTRRKATPRPGSRDG